MINYKENGEEIQAYSLKRRVEWPIGMLLECSKEKRGFSRED
jgi:hypothetical protein